MVQISELKAEVRRYQEQMHEVTVGLRADCESCRRNNTTRSELSVQTSPAAVDYDDQLAQKTKEIAILKALCKSRHQRIAELEQGSVKVPRPHRYVKRKLICISTYVIYTLYLLLTVLWYCSHRKTVSQQLFLFYTLCVNFVEKCT